MKSLLSYIKVVMLAEIETIKANAVRRGTTKSRETNLSSKKTLVFALKIIILKY